MLCKIAADVGWMEDIDEIAEIDEIADTEGG